MKVCAICNVLVWDRDPHPICLTAFLNTALQQRGVASAPLRGKKIYLAQYLFVVHRRKMDHRRRESSRSASSSSEMKVDTTPYTFFRGREGVWLYRGSSYRSSSIGELISHPYMFFPGQQKCWRPSQGLNQIEDEVSFCFCWAKEESSVPVKKKSSSASSRSISLQRRRNTSTWSRSPPWSRLLHHQWRGQWRGPRGLPRKHRRRIAARSWLPPHSRPPQGSLRLWFHHQLLVSTPKRSLCMAWHPSSGLRK